MLNPDFSDFDQEMLNQLRKLTAVMESKKLFAIKTINVCKIV